MFTIAEPRSTTKLKARDHFWYPSTGSRNRYDWYECGYVDALKCDCRLVLVDARGHGNNDKPHGPEAHITLRRNHARSVANSASGNEGQCLHLGRPGQWAVGSARCCSNRRAAPCFLETRPNLGP